jgi:RNA polymerase sigma factor (sigma-70 family)
MIRHAGGPQMDGDDGRLLQLFVETSNTAAFGELVRRYARLVWGQCRGLLGNDPDADDAFQATFLALARSAPSIRDTARLGSWLHRVAYRVCLNARRVAARRRQRERGAAAHEGTTPVADSAWAAAEAALHEELCRLPASLREPFVMCCLEGRRPTDVARQLGLSWGTLSARLSRAKRRLLDRLSDRGFGAGVVVGAACWQPTVSAGVVERAIALGSNGAPIPASVLSLYSGVSVMGLSRSKWLALLGIMAAAVAALFGSGGRGPIAPVARATPGIPAAPVPKEDPAVKRKNLEELWALLLVQDEAIGSRALLELAARPKKDVVAFLADKLKPLKLSAEQAKKLLADLGDMKEETAQATFETLCYFDPRLALEVGDMLKDLPAGQHRQRVAALLVGSSELNSYVGCTIEYQSAEALTAQFGEKMCANFSIQDTNKLRAGGPARYSTGVAETVAELSRWQWHKQWGRATRAVIVLEHLGTPDAVKVLETMATGHADASPTKAAKAALERLKSTR